MVDDILRQNWSRLHSPSIESILPEQSDGPSWQKLTSRKLSYCGSPALLHCVDCHCVFATESPAKYGHVSRISEVEGPTFSAVQTAWRREWNSITAISRAEGCSRCCLMRSYSATQVMTGTYVLIQLFMPPIAPVRWTVGTARRSASTGAVQFLTILIMERRVFKSWSKSRTHESSASRRAPKKSHLHRG
jgi:hypothetical protein